MPVCKASTSTPPRVAALICRGERRSHTDMHKRMDRDESADRGHRMDEWRFVSLSFGGGSHVR